MAPLLLAALLASVPRSPAPPDACGLLAGAEVARVQGSAVVAAKATGGGGVSQCFYVLDHFASSVSLELVRGAAARQRWNQKFHVKEGEREQEEEREHAGGTEPVPGLGEEAYWTVSPVNGALYVLAGDAYFRLSMGGALAGEEREKRCRRLAAAALAALRSR